MFDEFVFESRLDVDAPSSPRTRRSELDLLREFASLELVGNGGIEDADVDVARLLRPVDRVSPMDVARARSEDVTLDEAIL